MFVDDSMFTNIGISNSINILNFIDATIEYIHIDAFNPIKPYITKFLFDGMNNKSLTRFAKNIKLYNSSGVIEKPIVRNLMFDNNRSNISELCGFNINNVQSDYTGLFTSNEMNLTSIHDIFTNLDQFTSLDNESEYTKAYGLNEIGLSNLQENLTLYNAFRCTLDYALSNLSESDLIDFSKFISFSADKNQFKYIQENIPDKYKTNIKYNSFDFYKKVYTYSGSNGETNGWETLWSVMNIPDISNLFNKCIIYTNDNDYILTIPSSIDLSNVKKAYQLFSKATIRYKGSNFEEVTGIKLNENSLAPLYNLESAPYMFSETIFNGKTEYPLIGNIFAHNSKLTDLRYMFSKSKILGNHKTYITYDENNNPTNGKSTYYIHVINETINKTDNSPEYSSATNYLLSDINYANKDVFTTAYQFIPDNLFASLPVSGLQLSYMFEYSDFEGYIPSGLFTGKNITNLSGFILDCKILPQLIEGEENKYVFINSNFITNKTSESSIDLFNFYILCGNDNNKIYCIVQDSIGSEVKFGGFNLHFGVNSGAHLVDYYYNDGLTSKIIYVNKTGIHINLYYDSNNNIEGAPISLLNNMNPGSILCNEYLSLLINGYILTPGTIITEHPNRKLVKCGLDINAGAATYTIQMSRNAKLPLVEIMNPITMGNCINNILTDFNGEVYYYTTFKNSYYNDSSALLINNTRGATILYDYMFDNYVESEEAQEHINNVYNNYLLLLNGWAVSQQTKTLYGNSNKWKFETSLYNNLQIYSGDELNQSQMLISVTQGLDEVILKNNYTFYSIGSYSDGDDSASAKAKNGKYSINP